MDPSAAGATRWTVVVPTRARPEQLRRCLIALLAVGTDAGEPELVVVDDDPELSAAGVIAALDESGGRIRTVNSGGAGPATARNAGVREAGGEMVAFTDDDCEPDPGWLRGFEAALADAGAEAAAGSTVNGCREAASEASQLVVDALRAAHRDGTGPSFAPSNNFAISRSRFNGIGGFDERFPFAAAEDRDLCERWVESGGAIADASGAVVTHRHRLSLRSFWSQHLRYGIGAYSFHRARRRRNSPPIGLQPEIYSAIAGEVRAAEPGRRRSSLAALAAISQIANATGYLVAMIRARVGRAGSATPTTDRG